jgi:hypothetical protein
MLETRSASSLKASKRGGSSMPLAEIEAVAAAAEFVVSGARLRVGGLRAGGGSFYCGTAPHATP